MKNFKRHPYFAFVAVVLLLLFIGLAAKSVSATPSSPQPDSGDCKNVCLGITLGNTNNPSSYKITGKVNGQTVPFSYSTNSGLNGGNGAFVANIPGTGGSSQCNTPTETQQNTVQVLINGGTYGNASYDVCGDSAGNIYWKSISVTSQAQQLGSISGKADYEDASGQNQPVTNACIQGTGASAVGPNATSYPLSFDSNGDYSTPDTLPAGQYTININCVPTDPADNTNHSITKTVTLAAGQNLTNVDLTAQSAQQAPSTASTGTAAAPTCESDGGTLSWFVCAVINGVSDAEGSLEHVVQDLLVTPTFNFSPNTNCSVDSTDPTSASSAQCTNDKVSSDIYNVWSNFRIYADILLVIALLVAIYSEAIGGGVLDAYTVQKMLPRILIAAILINLSIYIVAGLEDIINVIGAGVYGLIKDAFGSSWQLHLNGNGDLFGVGGGILAVLTGGAIWKLVASGGGGAIGDGLAFIALFVGLPILLAVLGTLLTLMFRQAILALLIMTSPIAFALYCLPNTEQYFKKWWDFLFKTLLVYPIVMLVFAMSGVAAVVFNFQGAQGGSTDVIYTLMSLLAVVAPIFLIPFAFKFAGGAVGSINQGLSSIGKRGAEAIKGNANDQGSLQNRLRQRFGARRNEAGLTGGAVGMAMNPRFLRKGGIQQRREAISDQRAATRARLGQQMLERSDIWQHNKEDSKFLLAHANEGLAKQRMAAASSPEEKEQWRRAIDTAKLVPRTQATQMASAIAWVSSGYDLNSDGQTAYNEIAQTMGSLTGATLKRDPSTGNVIGFEGAGAGAAVNAMNEVQAKVGRQGGQWHLAGINYGTGYDPGQGLSKASIYELANGKPDGIKSMVDKIGIPPAGLAAASPAQQHEAAVTYKELQAALPNSKGGTQQEIIKQINDLEAQGIKTQLATPTGSTITVPEQFERTSFATQALASIAAGDNRMPGGAIDANWTAEKEAQKQGWTATEVAAGTRVQTRAETVGDVAGREARSYERPNPDVLAAATTPPTPPPAPSDARLKKDISFVGVANGVNLYSFSYIWSDQKYVGVMAQELLDSHPEAVITGKDGYYLVDYNALGLSMCTLESWRKQH